MVSSHSKGEIVPNRRIQNVGASDVEEKVKSFRNRSSGGFVKKQEANVWNTEFCALETWELSARTAHPRYFKTKAPRKKCHKSNRLSTNSKKNLYYQDHCSLGSMFSIVKTFYRSAPEALKPNCFGDSFWVFPGFWRPVVTRMSLEVDFELFGPLVGWLSSCVACAAHFKSEASWRFPLAAACFLSRFST